MPTLVDHSVGWGVESTFATPVTVSRFGEWVPGNSLDFDPNVQQGQGIRTGSRFARSARRLSVIGQGSGSLKFELLSKGLGTMLQSCFGTATSTLVVAGTFQQLFTPTTSSVMPSLTIQEGIVQKGGAGTTQPLTWAGCSVTSFTIEQPAGGIMALTANFDAASITRATALVTPTFVSGGNLFSFAAGTATIGGTLTVPTTTALGSTTGATSAAIRSWSLSVDNGLDTAGWRVGARSQPTAGMASGKLKASIEYDSTTGNVLHDAFVNQTSIPLVFSSTTNVVITSGNLETLQVCIPEARINSGAIPQPSDDKTVVTDIEFEIMDNSTAPFPLYLAVRTSDTAL